MTTPDPQTRADAPRRQHRWLASVIAATSDPAGLPALPFQRGNRRRPAGLAAQMPSAPTRPAALAAR